MSIRCCKSFEMVKKSSLPHAANYKLLGGMKGSACRVARRLEKISLSIASLNYVVRARARP
jgi:hypothetical protein